MTVIFEVTVNDGTPVPSMVPTRYAWPYKSGDDVRYVCTMHMQSGWKK